MVRNIIYLVLGAFLLSGCGRETSITKVGVTPLGISVIGVEMLGDDWADIIDSEWVEANYCYDKQITGEVIIVRIVDCPRMCDGGKGPLCFECDNSKGTGWCGGQAIFPVEVRICSDYGWADLNTNDVGLQHEYRHIVSNTWDRDGVPKCIQ